MASSSHGADASSLIERQMDEYIYVFDRRKDCNAEKKLHVGDISSLEKLHAVIREVFGIDADERYAITTTNREEIKTENEWKHIEAGDTIYILQEISQELMAQTKERVSFLPHYDTIVKGGMYEYYASEGQNPLPYAFAELIDNALAATALNTGPRNIEIRLHLDEKAPGGNTIFVIDNGKGMTSRQLNNWAVYRLSKFIRTERRGKLPGSEEESYHENESLTGAPRSLNSDISYFGVGGKQAIFFIGSATRMISKPKDTQDVHELTISKDEFEEKEKNREAIYSGYITNRKAGDASHIVTDEENLKNVISEEVGKESFTTVVINNINPAHINYLKNNMNIWTRHLSHIYHYYIHGPNGNVPENHPVMEKKSNPFTNIDIVVKLYPGGGKPMKEVNLRTIGDDMQSQYIKSSANNFEFKATLEGTGIVEGILRYHPFLYDRETYPTDSVDHKADIDDEEVDFTVSETRPARGKRPIFECYWNGRLIPYTNIEDFEWCATPKKSKALPLECYNRVSGVLWTNDKFQVSTNKLTFIDLEMKLRDKNTAYTRILSKSEKRTDMNKEYLAWLKECHEKCDKQIKFSQFCGTITRQDLPKKIQGPWAKFKQIEWDGKVYKAGSMVRIIKTVPFTYGTVKQFLLFGEYDGDVFATGGEVEIVKEPKMLYDEVKMFPLSKLDRQANQEVVDKYIEDEESKLPDHLVVTWPEGSEVKDGEERLAGDTIGAIKVEIANRKKEMISKLPGSVPKKLLVELKVIWHSKKRDEVIAQHISQHGKNWPYWFRKMTNVKNLGKYTIHIQTMLNESGQNTFAGKSLPSHKVQFTIVEGEAEKFTVGQFDTAAIRIGQPFSIPLEFQDEYGHQTTPSEQLKPTVEVSGLDVVHDEPVLKGSQMVLKNVVLSGEVSGAAGKNFTMIIKIPMLSQPVESMKVRILPGLPAELHISTENICVENGKSLSLEVEVKDTSGNLAAGSSGKLNVICKFLGINNLPTYTVDCGPTGKGILTGSPLIIKDLANTGQNVTAKFEVQGNKSIPAVEKEIKVTPSSQASRMEISYTDMHGQSANLNSGQEMIGICGDHIQGLRFVIKDEASRIKTLDKTFIDNIKVNWTPKISSDELLLGLLPDIKVPNLISDSKYCHISVADTNLEFSFTLKGIPGSPAALKCSCEGTAKVRLGEKLESPIVCNIIDKFGNEIQRFTKSDLDEVEISGEGLIVPDIVKELGENGAFTISKISFDVGRLGSREVCVQWKKLKFYVRIEVVAGPPANISIPNWDLTLPLTVFNDSRLRQLLHVQLCDEAGNNSPEANVKVQLARDHGIKLLPVPQPVRTNKFGAADFGHLTVQGLRGVYEIQPKAFIGKNTISGPKIKIAIEPDLSKPVRIDINYDKSQPILVNDQLPEITAQVFAEGDEPIQMAKSSCICLKLWRAPQTAAKPQHRYGADSQSKQNKDLATFTFTRKAPPVAGPLFAQVVYAEGKTETSSQVFELAILPGAPYALVPTETPGVPTVSNAKNIATRTLIRQLHLQLMDKHDNPCGSEINGKVNVMLCNTNPASKIEVPRFAGDKPTISVALTEGRALVQNLIIAENSQGRDGQQYLVKFTTESEDLDKDSIAAVNIPFLFYNDMKKHAQMAQLTKERDNLKSAIKTYKSLFDTTQQLIDELKISLNEAKDEEQRLKQELKKLNVASANLSNMMSIDTLINTRMRERDQLKNLPRRACGLQPAPQHPDVLGKIAHLAEVLETDIARVLSWHMSADMDCVVTLSTRKAKEIYNQSGGKQQVLPLDSIFKKNLPDWNKPLPHIRIRPQWHPAGNPVYARNMLLFPHNEADCRIVFGMLLGDTIILDTLDDANAYRQEIVKHTHCPTILTREGDRIRSNGKFGGLMNKALPIEKLRGAVFSEPLPKRYTTICSQIDILEQFKIAVEKRESAEEEWREQVANQDTPEMKTKHSECLEAEKQLRDIEERLGLTAKRGAPPAEPANIAVTPPPAKRSRHSNSSTPVTNGEESSPKSSPSVNSNHKNSPVVGTRSGRTPRRSQVFDPSPEPTTRKRSRKT